MWIVHVLTITYHNGLARSQWLDERHSAESLCNLILKKKWKGNDNRKCRKTGLPIVWDADVSSFVFETKKDAWTAIKMHHEVAVCGWHAHPQTGFDFYTFGPKFHVTKRATPTIQGVHPQLAGAYTPLTPDKERKQNDAPNRSEERASGSVSETL